MVHEYMKIPKDTVIAMSEHAREKAPEECCGLILKDGRKVSYWPCANAAADPKADFRISTEDWAETEDLGVVAAVVHSHSGQSARLSAVDRTSMEATALPWVIIEVCEGLPVSQLVHEPIG